MWKNAFWKFTRLQHPTTPPPPTISRKNTGENFWRLSISKLFSTNFKLESNWNFCEGKIFECLISFSVQEETLTEDNPYEQRTTRAIRNLTRKKTCFVCHKQILGSNISSHLSSAHGFTRRLTRYLLDTERVRSQKGPDLLNVQDCVTCLRRFVACSSHCHQLPECVLVDVPNYMEPDSLCEEAKIIKALCGGGQPTPRSCRVTLRAAYEELKKLFEGE